MKQVLPQYAIDLVQWHEARRDAKVVGHEGLLVDHVKHPYHIDIDNGGNWQLWHFDSHDESKIVAKGMANNVEEARLAAVGAAVAKITSLRNAIAAKIPQQNQDIPQDGHVTNLRRTLRLYAAGAALVLWLGFGTYLFFKVRPVVATLAVIVLAVGLYVAHIILETLERFNSRREKLLKQQAAQALVKQQAQVQKQQSMAQNVVKRQAKSGGIVRAGK